MVLQSVLKGNVGGIGGHYSSVRDLQRAFAQSWPDSTISVLTIGNIRPPSLEGIAGGNRYHIEASSITPRRLFDFLRHVEEDASPTHVHSFDNNSFALARTISHRAKAKLYITRPGGPNPRVYFPSASDIICFSAENRDYLAGRRKHRGSRIHLIPQRVQQPTWDTERIESLRAIAGTAPILLRVARLASLNAPSLKQTIALSRFLCREGIEHRLVIIGIPSEPEIASWVRSQLDPADLLVTDPFFTTNAEQLTPIATAVVGSGRSLIEAAMAGASLYVPLAGSEIPTLVHDRNWRQLAVRNFSARSELSSELRSSPTEAARGFAESNISLAVSISNALRLDEQVVRQYRELYEDSQPADAHPLDYALNWLPLIRALRT